MKQEYVYFYIVTGHELNRSYAEVENRCLTATQNYNVEDSKGDQDLRNVIPLSIIMIVIDPRLIISIIMFLVPFCRVYTYMLLIFSVFCF